MSEEAIFALTDSVPSSPPSPSVSEAVGRKKLLEGHKQFFGNLFSSIRNDELRDVTPEIDTIVAIGKNPFLS